MTDAEIKADSADGGSSGMWWIIRRPIIADRI